jgi:DNA-binding transcriptional regulator YiaG
MSIIEMSSDCSDLSKETALYGRNLRSIRRSHGLTQNQLADLIGVAQPNISRWESGFDEASPRCREKLVSIFLNKSGRMDRFVEHFALSDPDVNVFSVAGDEMKFLHVSPSSAHILQVENNELVGSKISNLMDRGWLKSVFGDTDMSDLVHSRYSHDIAVGSDSLTLPPRRIYVTSFTLNLASSEPVLLTKVRFKDATGRRPCADEVLTTANLTNV